MPIERDQLWQPQSFGVASRYVLSASPREIRYRMDVDGRILICATNPVEFDRWVETYRASRVNAVASHGWRTISDAPTDGRMVWTYRRRDQKTVIRPAAGVHWRGYLDDPDAPDLWQPCRDAPPVPDSLK